MQHCEYRIPLPVVGQSYCLSTKVHGGGNIKTDQQCDRCIWAQTPCEPRTMPTAEQVERATAKPGPCVHLGQPTGETATCRVCSGNVRVKLFACAVHGRCTMARKVEGAGCCKGCGQHESYRP